MSELKIGGGLPLASPHIAGETFGNLGKAEQSKPATPFAQFLVDAVDSANEKQLIATREAEAFAAGQRDDIHGTMIAAKEAEIELKLVSNVRTKLVEAWNDMWRMSV